MTDLERLVARAEQFLERVEALLPAHGAPGDWAATAYRWRRRLGRGGLEPVRHPHRMALDDLLGIDRQRALLEANTRQFVAGAPANNALLWGSRGTGKSSLIKALLHAYAGDGLRLVEVDKHELLDLPDIVALLEERPERFLLYCDDLSFEAEDPSYKALKALLDGSVSSPPDNVLLYATSNRRHLLPEFHAENLAARVIDEEIHHGEAVEEKISLSDRFGLWVSFHPFDQAQYLAIVHHWVRHFAGPDDAPGLDAAALRWALMRGSRSGRTAQQFARDWAGRRQLECGG
jgi:predicted AAA+ superfamily ATPase